MTDTPYTNREIDGFHQNIAASLARIETQTTATNGKVRFLEKMVWLACGGLAVLSYFFGQDKLLLSAGPDPTAADIQQELIEARATVEKLRIEVEEMNEGV